MYCKSGIENTVFVHSIKGRVGVFGFNNYGTLFHTVFTGRIILKTRSRNDVFFIESF